MSGMNSPVQATCKAIEICFSAYQFIEPFTYVVHTVAWHVRGSKKAHVVRMATFLSQPIDRVIGCIAYPLVAAALPVFDVVVEQPLAARVIKGLALGLSVPLFFTIGLVAGSLSLILVPFYVIIPIHPMQIMQFGDDGTELFFKTKEQELRNTDVLGLFH